MDYTVKELLNDGFTIKMAEFYSGLMKAERESGLWNSEYIDWAHSHGFLAESASAYYLNDDNISDYLSDYDYYKIWPLNSWERIWINDKLTLRYMLLNNKFDKYMPRYYYYYDSKKGLVPLIDNDNKGTSVDDFIDCLKATDNQVFACKPNNGSGSQGFFKINILNDNIFLNNHKISIDELKTFLSDHPNYIYTEYLDPCESLSDISDIIHTLRIVVANKNVDKPFIIGGYIRFANNTTGIANHMTDTSQNVFDVDASVNIETGEFFNGRAVYLNKVEKLFLHPDSGKELTGVIPHWDEIKSFILDFAETYCLCEYLGYDLCVSTKGIKLMEINSHPGIKHMQLAKPLMSEGIAKEYFKEKIKNVDEFSQKEQDSRSIMWR